MTILLKIFCVDFSMVSLTMARRGGTIFTQQLRGGRMDFQKQQKTGPLQWKPHLELQNIQHVSPPRNRIIVILKLLIK